MKKLMIGMMLTISVLCLAACGGSSIKVGSFSSLIFDSDEYDDAVNEINIIVAEIRSRVQLTNPSDLLNYLFSMNMICSINSL